MTGTVYPHRQHKSANPPLDEGGTVEERGGQASWRDERDEDCWQVREGDVQDVCDPLVWPLKARGGQ